MFNTIAPRYDLLNHLLSLGIDRGWRKALVRAVKRQNPNSILDVATGTGDLAISLARHTSAERITGADISSEMLRIGRQKVAREGLDIELIEADAQTLPFADAQFEAVTAAFGVRNFENLSSGLRDMHRVIANGGSIYILEFSMPHSKFIAWFYRLYFHHILPVVGGWISRDRKAYSYLPKSVDGSVYGQEFANLLREIGFQDITLKPMTGAIATLYTGVKR